MELPSKILLVCASFVCATLQTHADTKEKIDSDPIRIASFDWTSAALTSTILAKILVDRGYNVQMIAASSLVNSIQEMHDGKLTIGLEYRMTGADSDPDQISKIYAVDNLGPLGPIASQIWWFPNYVKDICPDLPSLKGLAACASQFSSPQSAGRGLLISGPVGWGYDEDTRVAALGLPFDVVHVATDTTIAEKIESAVANKEPILLALNSPTWITSKYEGSAVTLPPWTRECDTDPSWGSNPYRTKDCGDPTSHITKLAWPGMKTKWHQAWLIAKNLSISESELDSMLYEVDYKGKSLDTVAAQWIRTHSDIISQWIAAKD